MQSSSAPAHSSPPHTSRPEPSAQACSWPEARTWIVVQRLHRHLLSVQKDGLGHHRACKSGVRGGSAVVPRTHAWLFDPATWWNNRFPACQELRQPACARKQASRLLAAPGVTTWRLVRIRPRALSTTNLQPFPIPMDGTQAVMSLHDQIKPTWCTACTAQMHRAGPPCNQCAGALVASCPTMLPRNRPACPNNPRTPWRSCCLQPRYQTPCKRARHWRATQVMQANGHATK